VLAIQRHASSHSRNTTLSRDVKVHLQKTCRSTRLPTVCRRGALTLYQPDIAAHDRIAMLLQVNWARLVITGLRETFSGRNRRQNEPVAKLHRTINLVQVCRWLENVCGPLLDRIDLYLEAPAVPFGDLSGTTNGTTSGEMFLKKFGHPLRRPPHLDSIHMYIPPERPVPPQEPDHHACQATNLQSARN
jgi:hypothetical protein